MRMNIDEKWKTDPRRTLLVNRLRTKTDRPDRIADGMLVEITWVLFSHKGEGVPLKEFKFIEYHEDWLDCGLGEIDGNWVRIAGSDRYEDFFEKQAENGSKGGRPAKNPKKPKKPKKTQNNPTEPNPNPENPSFSSSGSFSGSLSAEERAGAPAAALSAAPVGEFEIAGDFRGNSKLEHVLAFVPLAVQQDWTERWETRSVKETLLNGVGHYLTETGKPIHEIDDWGKLLVAWVKREKKTLVKRRPPSPIATLPPAEIEVPEVSPEETLAAAAKLKLGPGAKAALERQAGGAS